MKKLTKVFLGVVAALLVGTSFTGCEALLDALMGTDMTMAVKSSIDDLNKKQVTVKAYKYESSGSEYAKTGDVQTMIFIINGDELNISDYVKSTEYYDLYVTKIGTTKYTEGTSDEIHVTYKDSGYAATGNNDTLLCVAGNADYVITITKNSKTGKYEADLKGTMQE